MRSHYCGLVTEALNGQTVSLCGWVNRRRDHGGVIFIDLRDREGYVQVVCDPDRPEMFKVAEDVRNEFCVQIKGLVRARPAGTENANLTSGKIEVLCRELEVLNPSVTPYSKCPIRKCQAGTARSPGAIHGRKTPLAKASKTTGVILLLIGGVALALLIPMVSALWATAAALVGLTLIVLFDFAVWKQGDMVLPLAASSERLVSWRGRHNAELVEVSEAMPQQRPKSSTPRWRPFHAER